MIYALHVLAIVTKSIYILYLICSDSSFLLLVAGSAIHTLDSDVLPKHKGVAWNNTHTHIIQDVVFLSADQL